MPNRSANQRLSDARQLLETTLEQMGIQAEVSASLNDEGITADISGDDLSALIGGRGRTLNALQCLINMAANHRGEDWIRVLLDAEGYRERRRESLEKYALKTAAMVVDEGKEERLEPMNAFERRIVHCVLASREDIETRSEGEEPYRCIVVSPLT